MWAYGKSPYGANPLPMQTFADIPTDVTPNSGTACAEGRYGAHPNQPYCADRRRRYATGGAKARTANNAGKSHGEIKEGDKAAPHRDPGPAGACRLGDRRACRLSRDGCPSRQAPGKHRGGQTQAGDHPIPDCRIGPRRALRCANCRSTQLQSGLRPRRPATHRAQPAARQRHKQSPASRASTSSPQLTTAEQRGLARSDKQDVPIQHPAHTASGNEALPALLIGCCIIRESKRSFVGEATKVCLDSCFSRVLSQDRMGHFCELCLVQPSDGYARG